MGFQMQDSDFRGSRAYGPSEAVSARQTGLTSSLVRVSDLNSKSGFACQWKARFKFSSCRSLLSGGCVGPGPTLPAARAAAAAASLPGRATVGAALPGRPGCWRSRLVSAGRPAASVPGTLIIINYKLIKTRPYPDKNTKSNVNGD